MIHVNTFNGALRAIGFSHQSWFGMLKTRTLLCLRGTVCGREIQWGLNWTCDSAWLEGVK